MTERPPAGPKPGPQNGLRKTGELMRTDPRGSSSWPEALTASPRGRIHLRGRFLHRYGLRIGGGPYILRTTRPRRRPHCVVGDRGYDAEAIRSGLRTRGILPLLAMRRIKHGSGLGTWRWVVERTFAWLNQFRRLHVRYDKRVDIHEAFLSLGCALICWHALRKSWMPR